MKSRALALLSISGIALAACSGGESNPTAGASNAGSQVPSTTDPTNQALLGVTESESHGWALSNPTSRAATVNVGASTAAFERTPRAAATDAAGTGTSASDRLQIKKEGVRYASGKTMFGPGGSGTIEELPLRALTIRGADSRGRAYEQGNDGSTPWVRPGQKTTGLSAFDGVLNYSAQVTEDGLVLKIGGNAIYFDFQRRFDMGEDINDWYGRGPDGDRGTADDGTDGTGKWDGCYSDVNGATADCTNWIHDDVQVTFGRPSSAPHGHYAWYWNTRLPLPDGSRASDDNLKASFDKHFEEVRDLGSYELWMTNLARINRNLEYADGPPHRSDDETLFLSHAAYGLLLYNDNISGWKTPGRMAGYHFGFDAFADSTDARTTDIASPVSATFRGTTMAQMVLLLTAADTARPSRVDLRGDIELTASIGGSGGGSISGVISGFKMLGPDGTWHPHAAIIDPTKQERLVLTGTNYRTRADANGVFSTANYAADAATINADGSYAGGLYLQTYESGSWKDKTDKFDTYVTDFDPATDINRINPVNPDDPARIPNTARFGGMLYGPTSDDMSNLETAGYWFLPADAACNRGSCSDDLLRSGPVYGAFGAAQ